MILSSSSHSPSPLHLLIPGHLAFPSSAVQKPHLDAFFTPSPVSRSDLELQVHAEQKQALNRVLKGQLPHLDHSAKLKCIVINHFSKSYNQYKYINRTYVYFISVDCSPSCGYCGYCPFRGQWWDGWRRHSVSKEWSYRSAHLLSGFKRLILTPVWHGGARRVLFWILTVEEKHGLLLSFLNIRCFRWFYQFMTSSRYRSSFSTAAHLPYSVFNRNIMFW